MAKGNKATPMMEQYLSIKAKHKDAVLFFRLGDFYEMFYDDAKIASEVLGLTLTSRAHGKSSKVPLAGFPYHSLENYLSKMIKAGYRVAICEQVEDPKQAKTVVKRDVTEVVTPGTVLTDDLLETKRNNFLGSVYAGSGGERYGLAFVDLSTGEFTVSELSENQCFDEIQKIMPAELLLSEDQAEFIEKRAGKDFDSFVTRREAWVFSHDYGYETLTKHYQTLSLKGFGCDDMSVGVSAAGAALHYLKEVQRWSLDHITGLQRRTPGEFMSLDTDTRRNLELLRSMRSGGSDGALISVIDKTRTPMGGRRLVQWLINPLLDIESIRCRHDAVEELVESRELLQALRDQLSKIGDLERFATKIAGSRANARDLKALKNSLRIVPELRRLLDGVESKVLQEACEGVDGLEPLADRIEKAIVDEPPLAVTEGGLIRQGYNTELDELREIAFSGKDWIARLQRSEREKTGIPSLKVSYNKVFGYYIEVTKPNLSRIPEYYIRKQTLVNAERFITPELKEYEEKVLAAEDKIVALEYDLFDEIRIEAAKHIRVLQRNAQHIAALDCISGFADLAIENNYVRPVVDGDSKVNIKNGRHPVVERLLPYGEAFIPNDTYLDNRKEQIMILTGPNMAGKSTFLRQVGLIVLLAQIGSFVPAESASIGVVDKVFTRVGASDNLAGGESTFLVEMNETANILNNATERSLILLDEIGRGTSTFDGLSIAWAVAEFLHNESRVAAKSIFATHYHELTELALILPRVHNYNVVVKEWGDNVVFLRKVEQGGCDHSYGIQVAKLAGLPQGVIGRAREILANLEANELTANKMPKLALPQRQESPSTTQLDIFARQENELRKRLEKLNVEEITPVQALLTLNELKSLITKE